MPASTGPPSSLDSMGLRIGSVGLRKSASLFRRVGYLSSKSLKLARAASQLFEVTCSQKLGVLLARSPYWKATEATTVALFSGSSEKSWPVFSFHFLARLLAISDWTALLTSRASSSLRFNGFLLRYFLASVFCLPR